MFKVGDRVTSEYFGEGNVVRIMSLDNTYPVIVEFDEYDDETSFTMDGYYNLDRMERKRIRLVKEDDTSSQEYTTGQMIDLLLDNPKRQARLICEQNEWVIVIDVHNNFTWKHNGEEVSFKTSHKDRRWIVIEPKVKELKKMNFADAFKFYIDGKSIVSCESNETYNKSKVSARSIETITTYEIEGLWTVDGVYEDNVETVEDKNECKQDDNLQCCNDCAHCEDMELECSGKSCGNCTCFECCEDACAGSQHMSGNVIEEKLNFKKKG